MMEGESGELVFLRYAHPVIGYCNDVGVEADELACYTEMLKTGRGEIDRGRLEELFPDAVKHLKSWLKQWTGNDVEVIVTRGVSV